MKIICRDCGATIPAANINIQEMVAVCDHCNSFFALDKRILARKRKRVIPARPPRIMLYAHDDEHLSLSYRMALGPGQKNALYASSIGSVVLTAMVVGMSTEGAPGGAILLVGLLLMLSLYLLAAIITTTTSVSIDTDTLQIRTGPLPFPDSDNKILPLGEIRRIYADQTVEPFSGGVPANNVYAEMADSRRVPLVTSLPYDYAHYLALLLDDHLQSDADDLELIGPAFDDAPDADSVLNDDDVDVLLDGEISYRQNHSDGQ